MPKNMLEVQGDVAEQIVRLLEALEDLDDVQKVFSNFDVGEDVLARLVT
jgi:transcriptional/translational regulatory protein YebC/TACO1